MIKNTGLRLLSIGACLAVAWGCMQVDGGADQAQGTKAQSTGLLAMKQMTSIIPAALAKSAAASAVQQDPATCLANKSSCYNNVGVDYNACLFATDSDYSYCDSTSGLEYNSCSVAYNSCLASNTSNTSSSPAACAAVNQDDPSTFVACFQALGMCQGFIDAFAAAFSCDADCEANPPASLIHFGRCIENSGIDESSIASNPAALTASAINECVCGAGGGSVFGSLGASLQTSFDASSSNAGGSSFSGTSSNAGGSSFSGTSSNVAGSAYSAPSH